MGLDQYLYARRYVSGYQFVPEEQRGAYTKLKEIDPILNLIADGDTPSGEIEVTVAYWRKANAIHRWFVTNCQGGVDECQLAHVDRDQLTQLRDICQRVLADRSLADDELPTQGGFFFGSTGYDEYYFADLEHTVERLDHILATTNGPQMHDYQFFYRSSW